MTSERGARSWPERTGSGRTVRRDEEGDTAGCDGFAARPLAAGGVRAAVDPEAAPAEEAEEVGLRPRTLDEFVGQGQLTGHLRIVIEAAIKRQTTHRPPALRRTARAGQDVVGRNRRLADGCRATDNGRPGSRTVG